MSRGKVVELQLCQANEVIAVLDLETDQWVIENTDDPHDNWEPTPEEVEQLEYQLSGQGTGFMIFRGVEYEDVVVVAVRERS